MTFSEILEANKELRAYAKTSKPVMDLYREMCRQIATYATALDKIARRDQYMLGSLQEEVDSMRSIAIEALKQAIGD